MLQVHGGAKEANRFVYRFYTLYTLRLSISRQPCIRLKNKGIKRKRKDSTSLLNGASDPKQKIKRLA